MIRTRIVGKAAEGYRRGGVSHSRNWKEWPDEQFSNKQMEQIDEDLRIAVEVVKPATRKKSVKTVKPERKTPILETSE